MALFFILSKQIYIIYYLFIIILNFPPLYILTVLEQHLTSISEL